MARTMPLAKIICLFACSLGLQCLVQQCTTAADCPANAFCSNNTYCICDANWIGACNVPSVPLASTISQVFETGQTILFQINPITLNSNLLFGFLICQANASSLNLTINLWFETGSITEYNSSNALNTPYNS